MWKWDHPCFAFQAKIACSVTVNGNTIKSRPCGRPGEEQQACPTDTTCSVTLAGQSASLSFCERPPQPAALAESEQNGRPRHPHGRKPPRPCKITFTNGTTMEQGCLQAGGLFECVAVNLTRLASLPKPPGAPSLENVQELKVCKPVSDSVH